MSDLIWNGNRLTGAGGLHLSTNGTPTPSGIMDYDGNIYTEVTIGSQVWLAQNLKTTHYSDGTPIPNLTTFMPDWEGDTNGAYVWYDNNITYKEPFGALYNWYVVAGSVMNELITGYHVPTNSDWETLISNVGGTATAGLVLKESGNTHWTGPNTGASNPLGFTAVGAGLRDTYDNGYYKMQYDRCTFWCNDPKDISDAYFTSINANIPNMEVDTIGVSKSEGFTIRLIKN